MNKKHKNHNFTDVQTSERTVTMKKYTKLIALVLSVILGVSACCFNSFALNDKTVYDMGNGLTLTVSNDVPMAAMMRINTEKSFSNVFVGTSSGTAGILTSKITLTSNQRIIGIIFDTAPGTKLHFSIKDLTTGEYVGIHTNGFLPAVSGNATSYTYSMFTPGHSYRIAVYGDESFTASGKVIGFDD